MIGKHVLGIVLVIQGLVSLSGLDDASAAGVHSYAYIKVGQANPVTVQGTVIFNGFTGDNTTVPITFQVREVDNTTALETRTVTPAADGSYSFTTLLAGPHDISAKALPVHWLRQTRKNVNLSGTVTVNFSMYGGDIDGDGEITSADLALLLANME